MSDARNRPAPEARFEAHSHVFDLAAEAASLRAEVPATHGRRQKALYKNGSRTIALFALEDGASLAEHKAHGVVSIQCVQGELLVTAEQRVHRLGPMQVLILAPDVPHSVMAERQAAFLLQVSRSEQ